MFLQLYPSSTCFSTPIDPARPFRLEGSRFPSFVDDRWQRCVDVYVEGHASTQVSPAPWLRVWSSRFRPVPLVDSGNGVLYAR